MKTLLAVVTATATLALALPVAAQPLEIIVRGGTPTVIPSDVFRGINYNQYGPPFTPGNPNFDPAGAAINAELAIHPRFRNFPINVSLASTLAYSTGSWTVHQESCQARYASYDPVSNTFLVNGLPVPCR